MRAALKQGCVQLRAYVTPKINGINLISAQPLVATRLHGTATGAPIVELAPAAKIPTSESGASNKSKYVGVSWCRPSKKWQASISIDRIMKYVGYFENEKDAAKAFDECAGPLGRGVNFPVEGQTQAKKRGAHGIVSTFTGVSWRASDSKWVAEIREGTSGKSVYLGHFKSEVAAAKAYDDRAAALGRPLNFPAEGQIQALKRASSVYLGVHWNGSEWEALNREGSSLGTFGIEVEAARAYDDHLVASRGLVRVNFPEDGAGELRQAIVVPISKYVGVIRQPSMQGPRWVAKIEIDGKTVRLGLFDSEGEAAEAYDEKAGPLGRPVNNPKNGQTQAKKGGSSKFRGVHSVRGKWSSSISIDGKGVHLGLFEDEQAAARAFDDRAAPLGRPVNFPKEE